MKRHRPILADRSRDASSATACTIRKRFRCSNTLHPPPPTRSVLPFDRIYLRGSVSRHPPTFLNKTKIPVPYRGMLHLTQRRIPPAAAFPTPCSTSDWFHTPNMLNINCGSGFCGILQTYPKVVLAPSRSTQSLASRPSANLCISGHNTCLQSTHPNNSALGSGRAIGETTETQPPDSPFLHSGERCCACSISSFVSSPSVLDASLSDVSCFSCCFVLSVRGSVNLYCPPTSSVDTFT